MTTEPRQGSQALPAGMDAVRTYNQLGRDLVTLWVATAEQMIRLSADANEVAIERVRGTFGRWVAPGGSDVWNWWTSTAAGFLGAYRETLEQGTAASIRPASSPERRRVTSGDRRRRWGGRSPRGPWGHVREYWDEEDIDEFETLTGEAAAAVEPACRCLDRRDGRARGRGRS